MKTIIHVNKHVIAKNNKHGTKEPPIAVRWGYGPATYTHAVAILGPSVVVYRPDKPLPCGAKVWIETESPVHIPKRRSKKVK